MYILLAGFVWCVSVRDRMGAFPMHNAFVAWKQGIKKRSEFITSLSVDTKFNMSTGD